MKGPSSTAGTAEQREPPAVRGANGMAKNEKDRSLFEWTVLIVKLLTAFAALVAAIAELLRYAGM